MRDFLAFKFRVILNLYWIPFDAVVVFRPEYDFLFKFDSTYFDTVVGQSETRSSRIWKFGINK